MEDDRALRYVGDIDPSSAYREIIDKPGTYLVDVRTSAEWVFVGLPDLSDADKDVWRIEWTSYPMMAHNPKFFADLSANVAASGADALLFLCRSGQRSHAAAEAALSAPELKALGRPMTFYNVAEGFEGALDQATGHRGSLGGWKSRGLPWRQS